MLRPRMRFPAARILLVALGLAGLSVAIPGSASAFVPGPPCFGPTCVGKSPYITNRVGVSCASDATTLYTITGAGNDGNAVALRWSNFCHANWGKYVGVLNSYAADYWAETRDSHREGGSGPGPYTKMVDGTQLARVVLVDAGFNETECPQACVYGPWR